MPANVAAPSAPALIVRQSGATGGAVEIEVQSPDGFALHALDPVLRIGGVEFHKYKFSPTVGVYGIVYTISSADYDSLTDGAPITIGYGSRPSAAKNYGTLNKSAVVPVP